MSNVSQQIFFSSLFCLRSRSAWWIQIQTCRCNKHAKCVHSLCVEIEKTDGLIGENFRFASKVFLDQQWSCPMSIFDKGRCCAGEDLSHSLKKDNYFWSESEVGGSWLVFWEITRLRLPSSCWFDELSVNPLQIVSGAKPLSQTL